jgi:arginine N-succinyltransferase
MTQAANPRDQVMRGMLPSDAEPLSYWRNQTGVPLSLDSAEGEWLLLIDAESGQPQACLRLVQGLGLTLPRFSYHVGRVVHASAELGLFRTQTTLLLGNDHSGENELADLACSPSLSAKAQVDCLGRLVQVAFQRVQARPESFGERLIVELAGPRDEQNLAPFWIGLGAHFYASDPRAAQLKFGDAWRSHLAALLPRQTLYLSLLSEAAQRALGQVGTAGVVAAQALAEAGFGFSQHVRIDDGGPVWEKLSTNSPIFRATINPTRSGE